MTFTIFERETILRKAGHFRDLPPPNYCVVWEDPEDLDAPAKVTTPSREWLKMLMMGHVLPDVSAFDRIVYGCFVDGVLRHKVTGRHNEKLAAEWCRENGGTYRIIDYPPNREPVVGPMTEEQATEYILRLSVPPRVWRDAGNRQRFAVCRRAQMPKDRTFRSAWRLDTERDAA